MLSAVSADCRSRRCIQRWRSRPVCGCANARLSDSGDWQRRRVVSKVCLTTNGTGRSPDNEMNGTVALRGKKKMWMLRQVSNDLGTGGVRIISGVACLLQCVFALQAHAGEWDEAAWDWRAGDLIFRSGIDPMDDLIAQASEAEFGSVAIVRAGSGGAKATARFLTTRFSWLMAMMQIVFVSLGVMRIMAQRWYFWRLLAQVSRLALLQNVPNSRRTVRISRRLFWPIGRKTPTAPMSPPERNAGAPFGGPRS